MSTDGMSNEDSNRPGASRGAPAPPDGTPARPAAPARARLSSASQRQLITAALDAIPDLFFVVDLDLRLVEWNSRLKEVTGYSEAELATMHPAMLFDEAERPLLRDAIDEALRDGCASVEAMLTTHDGRRIPYEFNATVLLDPRGEPLGLSGTARDVTERRLLEEVQREQAAALQQAHLRFEKVIENVPGVVYQCVYELDGTLTFPFVHAGFARDIGIDFGVLQQRPDILGKIIHPEDADSFWASIEASRPGTAPWRWEGRVVVWGNVRWVWARSTPTHLEDGRILWNGVLLDITAQKETEEALRLSEARHRGLVEATPDLFFRLSREGRYLDVKTGSPDLLAASPESLVGGVIDDFVAPSLAEQWKEAIGDAIDSGENREIEYDLETRDGELHHFEARIVPIGPDEAQTIVRDVTERYAAERAIRASEVLFRSFVEATTQVVWQADAEGNATELSEAWSLFTGQTEEELNDWGWADALHPEDRPRVIEEWSAHLIAHEPFETEYRVRRHDGVYHRFHARAVPVFAEAFQGWVGTCVDVETQRRNAEALRQSEERLRLALDAARMGTWDVDLQTKRTVWSPHTLALYGMEGRFDGREESFYNLLSDEDRARIEAATEEALRKAEAGHTPRLSLNYRLRRPDGEVRWFRSFGRIYVDDAGNPERMLGIVLDVTDEKAHEAALVEAREAAEEAARLKSALLANMSHEIRTPLTGIIGFAEVIAEEAANLASDTAHVEFAQRIGESGRRLLETLNSVLDLAQLEAGHRSVRSASIDIRDVVAGVVSLFERQARAKGLTLTVSVPDDPITLDTDGAALGRVVTNLVSNAVKFTEAGGVEVEMTVEADAVEIRVADTGVGISAAFLPRLFEAFRQESEGVARHFEGNGLGMAITARLVEMLDGTISVESTKNVGTTFTVRLPLSA
jgi:PAS domain S-box-containing protein